MAHTTTRRRVTRVLADGGRSGRAEMLAVEEPLEIRVNGEAYATTMRTPGHDLELALGFLVAEGVIADPADVQQAMHCPDEGRDPAGNPTYNVVTVDLTSGGVPEQSRSRAVSSACGVCGVVSLDDVRQRSRYDLTADRTHLDPAVLLGLPDAMRAAQRGFDRTGGLHAAALCTAQGELLCLREDVGRHNALDKVVGWAFERGLLPLAGHVLQVSGRASFELVQKAWLAGCPALSAVSAPSSLAVDLAAESGLTLIGFSRGDRFTVYSAEHRVDPAIIAV